MVITSGLRAFYHGEQALNIPFKSLSFALQCTFLAGQKFPAPLPPLLSPPPLSPFLSHGPTEAPIFFLSNLAENHIRSWHPELPRQGDLFDTCKECRLVLEILVSLNQQPKLRSNSKSTRVVKKSRGINNQYNTIQYNMLKNRTGDAMLSLFLIQNFVRQGCVITQLLLKAYVIRDRVPYD